MLENIDHCRWAKEATAMARGRQKIFLVLNLWKNWCIVDCLRVSEEIRILTYWPDFGVASLTDRVLFSLLMSQLKEKIAKFSHSYNDLNSSNNLYFVRWPSYFMVLMIWWRVICCLSYFKHNPITWGTCLQRCNKG